MSRYIVSLLILPLIMTPLLAKESLKDMVNRANEKYEQSDFEEAQKLLERAREEKPGDPIVNYNLGSVYHQQGDYEQASDSYMGAMTAQDTTTKAYAHYNIGNTEFRAGNYEKAVDAYKQSLRLNPGDVDAKYNLEVALKRLQEHQQKQDQCQSRANQDQQQQDQQQQDQQQQDQQQQDQQQQEQQQEDREQDNHDQQEQNQDRQQPSDHQDDIDQQQQQRQAARQPVEMSEEDAERLLNAVTGNDRDVLHKLVRERLPVSGYQGKDW